MPTKAKHHQVNLQRNGLAVMTTAKRETDGHAFPVLNMTILVGKSIPRT